MRKLWVSAALAAGISMLTPAQAEPVVVAGDLRSPESAAWHAESNSWFISNMGGVTFDLGPAAGQGFITRVQGDVITAKWLTGVTRPRGVFATATHLYVAEPSAVAIVNIASALVVKRIAVPGANADLNDVVVDAKTGEVFVSSPSVGAIFVITKPLLLEAAVSVFAEGPDLTHPNGLTLEPGFVVSAGLGAFDPAGFGSGRVVRIDRISKQAEAITPAMGVLDGIVKDDDDYLVTEYMTGNLYRVARDGTISIAHKLAPGAADLGIDPVRRIIMVPETLANAAVTLPVL